MSNGEATDLRILRGFLLLSIAICFTMGCLNWVCLKFDDVPYPLLGSFNVFLIILLNYTKSKQLVGNLYLGLSTAVLVNLSFHSGGIYSMDTLSVAFIPVMAIALIDHKSGLAWFVFYIAYLWYLWAIIDTPELAAYYRAQTLVFEKTYYVLGGMALAFFMNGVFSVFYLQNRNLIAKLKAKEAALKVHVSQLSEQSILLTKTQKELKRSNAELEEYAHVASHDLMQPLRTVNSFAQLLNNHLKAKEINDQKSTEMLQFIVSGSNKMQTLITDLLEFAKHKKHGELKYYQENLGQLLLSVQADLKEQIDNNQVTIEKEILPDLFVIPIKINQLFQNLISNAIKFKKSEAPLVIQIGSIEKVDHWEFFVKDNGIGIEKEFQDKIFKPFEKLHHSSEYSGSGIGLATCVQIVKLHQGRLWVQSIKGEGSTFFFTIAKDLSVTTNSPIAKTTKKSVAFEALNN